MEGTKGESLIGDEVKLREGVSRRGREEVIEV